MEENNHNHSHDGIDNKEHTLDMQKQLSLLMENIKDNTDTAFSILKMHENDEDQDTVDVYRINCSNILDCEKTANEKAEHFNNMFKEIKSEVQALKVMEELESIFDEIEKLENSSQHYLINLLNLLK